MYPVVGEVFKYEAPPIEAGRIVANPHALARAEAHLVEAERAALRVLSQTGCTCKRKRGKPLAVAYARNGSVWVWVAAQLFPKAVQDEVLAHRTGKPRAWPAHYEPSGREHVELATCRDCRRTWAVMIRAGGYRVVELGAPKFGVEVQP